MREFRHISSKHLICISFLYMTFFKRFRDFKKYGPVLWEIVGKNKIGKT